MTDDFTSAVQGVVAMALLPAGAAGDPQRHAAYDRMCAAATGVDTETRNEAIGQLVPLIAQLRAGTACYVALACNNLVEQGGDPDLVAPAILARFAIVLSEAIVFVDACRAARKRHRVDRDEELDAWIEAHGEPITFRMPDNAHAYRMLTQFCQMALFVLIRSASARR